MKINLITIHLFLLCIWLIPLTFVFGQDAEKVIVHGETTKKIIALTFDADMTPKMLHMLKKKKVTSWYNKKVIDVLEREKVPATLFLTGMWVQTYPEITKELSENPLFEIGNHSYSHPGFSSPCYTLATTTESGDVYQITQTEKLLSHYATHHSMYFRFPGLCYDSEDLKIATNLGYKVIGGDVLGNDGFQKNSESIVNQVVSHATPGSIVVLHMMGGPNAPRTGDALSIIIKNLKKEGYIFVSMSDLLKK